MLKLHVCSCLIEIHASLGFCYYVIIMCIFVQKSFLWVIGTNLGYYNSYEIMLKIWHHDLCIKPYFCTRKPLCELMNMTRLWLIFCIIENHVRSILLTRIIWWHMWYIARLDSKSLLQVCMTKVKIMILC